MKATLMYAAGDLRMEDVPDAAIEESTDAVVRVTRACICGSDLWPYASMERSEAGQSVGHEGIGVVEDVGSQVTTVKKGASSSCRSLSQTAPARSATRGCRRRASTLASSATTA